MANDVTGPEQHAATVRHGLEAGRAQLPRADWSAEFIALDELVALAGRADELGTALESILTAIEDANQPYERLALGAIARAEASAC